MPHATVTQTRGDAPRLKEWVEYHAALGFDEFHVILDGAIDDSEEVLRGLPARIEIYPYPDEGEYYDGLSQAERLERVRAWRLQNEAALEKLPYVATDPVSFRQFQRLREVVPRIIHDRRGWLALIDCDEFINIPSGESIKAITAGATVPRLQFLNFNVDTTGYDPGRPVLAQQGARWSRAAILEHPDQRWATRVKSIVRFRAATPVRSIHRISFGRHVVLDPDRARLHHFRVPLQPMTPPLPYTELDPISRPARPAAG